MKGVEDMDVWGLWHKFRSLRQAPTVSATMSGLGCRVWSRLAMGREALQAPEMCSGEHRHGDGRAFCPGQRSTQFRSDPLGLTEGRQIFSRSLL